MEVLLSNLAIPFKSCSLFVACGSEFQNHHAELVFSILFA
jgi:hypothetical protein